MAYDQDKVGVIVNPDQTLQILSPAPEVMIADEFQRLGITNGYTVLRVNKPDTTKFFNAWRLDTGTLKIYLDLQVMKDVVIGKNEKTVAEQLKAIRPLWEEAVDNDDTAQIAAIKSDRQNIRNTLASKIAAINACTTATEVEVYLP